MKPGLRDLWEDTEGPVPQERAAWSLSQENLVPCVD
jgi:hypothetical protein